MAARRKEKRAPSEAIPLDLPVYLLLGHGEEQPSRFCTPAERAAGPALSSAAAGPDLGPCRETCPANTFVVLFQEMGSVAFEPYAQRMIKIFSRYDHSTNVKLHTLPKVKSSLVTKQATSLVQEITSLNAEDFLNKGNDFKTFPINFRVYDEGSELPDLEYHPFNTLHGNVCMSGMHKYPIRALDEVCITEINSDEKIDPEILETAFNGCLYPSKKFLAARTRDPFGSTNTWRSVISIRERLINILAMHGAGIYYVPICRMLKHQYYKGQHPAGTVDLPTDTFTALGKEYYKRLIEGDWTRLTPVVFPFLPAMSTVEKGIHSHISIQRQLSNLQQDKILDRLGTIDLTEESDDEASAGAPKRSRGHLGGRTKMRQRPSRKLPRPQKRKSVQRRVSRSSSKPRKKSPHNYRPRKHFKNP